MKKTFKTTIFAVMFALVTQVSVKAEPTSDQTNTQQSQLEQNKDSLKGAEDKRKELELSIEKLDNQIEDFMMKIEESKKGIKQTEKEIDNSKKEITKVEEEISNQQDIYDDRIRNIYKNGQADYFSIVFGSEDLSGLISNLVAIKKVISIDQKVASDLDLKKEELLNKKEELDDKYNKITTLKDENENKLTSLNNNIADQKKLIEVAKSQEKLYASKVSKSQELVNKTMAEVNKIRSQTPKYELSRGTTAISSSNIIAYASNFLGTPYLWGGTSPATGFDCSGFTQYVYAHFGVKIGRTTYDQINDGYGVSKDELQAGDLVFFGQNNNPTHMGIYVGNNTYIHSPRTGDVIKISSMDRSDYITGRRVK